MIATVWMPTLGHVTRWDGLWHHLLLDLWLARSLGDGRARAAIAHRRFARKLGRNTLWAVSYTHLTLPTICSV